MWHTANFPWDFAAGVGAVLTAFVAWYQLWRLRRDQRGRETLKVCERYESDQVLDRALCVLRDARNTKKLWANPLDYSLEATTVLNYLDGIALGVDQGFYDERVVRDHMEPIIKAHVAECLTEPHMSALGFNADDFPRLPAILERWRNAKPWYRGG